MAGKNSKAKKARNTKPKSSKASMDTNEVIEQYDERKKTDHKSKLDATNRDNDPNWYYLDSQVADQVSQLSFQQLAGYSVKVDNVDMTVPNILAIYLNPSPGVQLGVGPAIQQSSINLCAFRVFTKLAAFTGRTATYGPQDIGTMILAFGEIISCLEWIRRGFGVAYQMNPRNRAYPRKVLEAMHIDADDLFDNLAIYRTKFNTIVTMLNQLPIPSNIAYFDKCASLYEKIYLDANSDMAQTVFYNPATTWQIDESSYSGGTKLETITWTWTKADAPQHTQSMAFYLTQLMTMVNKLLNSSSLQVVYTDLLNLATKLNVPFWHFDYLSDLYIVIPEYNANFSLQMHNTVAIGMPFVFGTEADLATGYTPYNDVYPDPNNNTIMYNPTFRNLHNVSGGAGTCNLDNIVDMLTDTPSIEDRIEVTRFLVSRGTKVWSAGGNFGHRDFVLPDHYATRFGFWLTDNTVQFTYTNFRLDAEFVANVNASQISFGPRFYRVDASGIGLTGSDIGELNFYTVIDNNYLRRLHDFVGLGLYDLR